MENAEGFLWLGSLLALMWLARTAQPMDINTDGAGYGQPTACGGEPGPLAEGLAQRVQDREGVASAQEGRGGHSNESIMRI